MWRGREMEMRKRKMNKEPINSKKVTRMTDNSG